MGHLSIFSLSGHKMNNLTICGKHPKFTYYSYTGHLIISTKVTFCIPVEISLYYSVITKDIISTESNILEPTNILQVYSITTLHKMLYTFHIYVSKFQKVCVTFSNPCVFIDGPSFLSGKNIYICASTFQNLLQFEYDMQSNYESIFNYSSIVMTSILNTLSKNSTQIFKLPEPDCQKTSAFCILRFTGMNKFSWLDWSPARSCLQIWNNTLPNGFSIIPQKQSSQSHVTISVQAGVCGILQIANDLLYESGHIKSTCKMSMLFRSNIHESIHYIISGYFQAFNPITYDDTWLHFSGGNLTDLLELSTVCKENTLKNKTTVVKRTGLTLIDSQDNNISFCFHFTSLTPLRIRALFSTTEVSEIEIYITYPTIRSTTLNLPTKPYGQIRYLNLSRNILTFELRNRLNCSQKGIETIYINIDAPAVQSWRWKWKGAKLPKSSEL